MSDRPRTLVELQRDGNVATVLFTTENGVNVFCSETLGALGTAVEKLADDAETRFVVFRGAGKTFVAGADIKEMVAFQESDGHSFAKHGHHVFNMVECLPQVTVAAINGHAMGGGCELAMACDFRLAVRGAKLGQPESKLGLIPGWGGTIRLPRLVGPAVAKRLLFSGEAISAEEAARIGLVDQVVDSAEELEAATKGLFERLAPGSPAAIKKIKHALRLDDEIAQFGMCFSCADAREGMDAFLNKRTPQWTSWRDCGRL